jgi:carboxyl-terminal processing protease
MAKWLKANWLWVVALGAAAVYAPLVGRSQDEKARRHGLETLTEVIGLIQRQAMDPPGPTQVAHASIQGMLHTLDPHSNFMDEQEFRHMKEDQKGVYFGIGSIIQGQPDGSVAIVSTVPGGPSEKAGLRSGDCFHEIDGKGADGLSSTQVMRKLRGEKGTTVVVTVRRPGFDAPIMVPITRAEIPSNSVSHAFMLNAEVGFIKVRDFGEATSDDFAKALSMLRDSGMKALVLDLRDNPGGSLDSAVGISKQLLGPNEVILTQKGREGREPTVFSTGPDSGGDWFPLAVLINRGSASSSEIVSGAIQDHDRGLLVGETSWGKGLVQVVVPINRTRGLGLTIARYYTPSGRCIQRDYQHGLDDYYFVAGDEEPGAPGAEGGGAPPASSAASGPEYRTDLGRAVYGGGGIRPDYVVKPKMGNAAAVRLQRFSGAYLKFAVHDRDAHGVRLGQDADAGAMSRFRAWLAEQGIAITDKEWREAEGDIGERLSIEMQTIGYGADAGFRYQCLLDPQVKTAMEVLPEAGGLLRKK